mmetsp:Transcript_73231/g.238174  ORF Transcript_73231/g.238174 Transcript_73231/m.238174 type:complete len:345 (-) Transcript_73231:3046-4080(-)
MLAEVNEVANRTRKALLLACLHAPSTGITLRSDTSTIGPPCFMVRGQGREVAPGDVRDTPVRVPRTPAAVVHERGARGELHEGATHGREEEGRLDVQLHVGEILGTALGHVARCEEDLQHGTVSRLAHLVQGSVVLWASTGRPGEESVAQLVASKSRPLVLRHVSSRSERPHQHLCRSSEGKVGAVARKGQGDECGRLSYFCIALRQRRLQLTHLGARGSIPENANAGAGGGKPASVRRESDGDNGLAPAQGVAEAHARDVQGPRTCGHLRDVVPEQRVVVATGGQDQATGGELQGRERSGEHRPLVGPNGGHGFLGQGNDIPQPDGTIHGGRRHKAAVRRGSD